MTRIDLVEETPLKIPEGGLSPALIQRIHELYSTKLAIETPSFLNEHSFVLKARGWVGLFPLGEDGLIVIAPKVPVGNLLRMWDYINDLDTLHILGPLVGVDSIMDLYEGIARILANRVDRRLKQGLYLDYLALAEELRYARGRIEPFATTIRSMRGRVALYCQYNEITADIEDNRLLLWTMYLLAKTQALGQLAFFEVARALRGLANTVSLTPVSASRCVGRPYHKLNEDYRPMHSLCRFLLENTGPVARTGSHSMYCFGLHMPSLFESFVGKWLERNTRNRLKIERQYPAHLEGGGGLKFLIDVVLKEPVTGKTMAVLDTKYKSTTSPSEEDIQQVVAYAVRMDTDKAFLVYPTAACAKTGITIGEVHVNTISFDLSNPNLESSGDSFLEVLTDLMI